jgi:hypothetical protein
MKLSSTNRSEIQPDLSDKSFKYLASYTQLEKLTRNIDGLRLVIFDSIKREEKPKDIENLIKNYKLYLKKLSGFGIATRIYEKYLAEMYLELEKLQK